MNKNYQRLFVKGLILTIGLSVFALALSLTNNQVAQAAVTTLRVYVAGESIEARNQFKHAPFKTDGTLNITVNDRNNFGWMVPLVDRLKLRDSSLSISWVGSETWAGADDNSYEGLYPSSTPDKTSAHSGTSIPAWLDLEKSNLQNKVECYDIAFAARGGNDFSNSDDADYKASLKTLIKLLDAGSNCTNHPLIYVTAHMPDDHQGDFSSTSEYLTVLSDRYYQRTADVVHTMATSDPAIRVRLVDQFHAFMNNTPTTAFPAPSWTLSDATPDINKIHGGDGYHPLALASIFAGEVTANAMNLSELHGLTGVTGIITDISATSNNTTSLPSSNNAATTGDFFNDSSGHWAHDYVEGLHVNCGINGYADSNGNLLHLFKANNSISRRELIKMLVQCSKETVTKPTDNPFMDVSKNAWGAGEIAYAKTHGWINGYADGNFKPDQVVNRVEALKMILLSAFSDAQITGNTIEFSDVEAGNWYVKYVSFAVSKGISSGYKDANGNSTGVFGTNVNLTRGEGAKMIGKVEGW